MEQKSSNFREEVTGSDDNTNKFVDKEEHEFSSDNDFIHDVDNSSETDQQEHLIDVSDLCRPDLLEDGMFTGEMEPIFSIGFNKNAWVRLVSQHLNANRSGFKHGTLQSSLIAIHKKINPYCSVMFKRHRVMLPKFRKFFTSIIFGAEGYCKTAVAH